LHIPTAQATLRVLTGGAELKQRVQHPKINECRERGSPYWFFRYWQDEMLPDGSIKSARKRQIVGPSRGPNAISRKDAETERDNFLAKLTGVHARPEAVASVQEAGAIVFGRLAQMWRTDFVERDAAGRSLIASTTKAKYLNCLVNHILPRWANTHLAEFRTKDLTDWLQETCEFWYMMADLRNVMSGIITKAHEWEIIPEMYANPMRRVKLPKKFEVREKRILDEDQTARVVARLADPPLLICETCLDAGTRISEVLGLKVKHVDLERGCARIEQRNCRGDIDEPKTEKSKRALALGNLAPRYATRIAGLKRNGPEAWIFPQAENPAKPMWDTGVLKALKLAAAAEGCDFPGFGPHSLRRANITWRQEVGGSSIETSRIAGHSNTKMTEEYTVVQLKRQDELTRRIQDKRAKAGSRSKPATVAKIDKKREAA